MCLFPFDSQVFTNFGAVFEKESMVRHFSLEPARSSGKKLINQCSFYSKEAIQKTKICMLLQGPNLCHVEVAI